MKKAQNPILHPFKKFIILSTLVFSLFLVNIAAAEVVDIMLVYDTTGTDWVDSNGGMAIFSQDTVNRMNQAMQNSNLSHSFRLVHSMSVDYTTTSDGSTPITADLYALQAGTGVFAPVHTARDTYKADLVAMMVDTGSAWGYVGVGYLLNTWGGQPNYCFTVNAIRAVDTGHTLTHEVGHNLGAHHSKFQSLSPGPNTALDDQYSAGWYFTGTNDTKYHTIMAYNSDGYGSIYQEAPLFSTPLVAYQETTAGDADDGDNVRLINQTVGPVAAYRDSELTLTGLTISGPTSVNETSTASYWATASWSDGSTSMVTPVWSEDSIYATISSVGVLSASSVTANQSVTVSANYTFGEVDKIGTHAVTVFNVAASLALGEAIDNTSLTWITGGDTDWFGQATTAYFGGDAAQSGDIVDNQQSYIQTTVTGPGTISFYWQVSSEDSSDYLRFYIDGVEQSGSISGTTTWALKTFNIAFGSHILKWEYAKDASLSAGFDCGWVDQFVWTPDVEYKSFPWPLFLPAIISSTQP